MVNNEKHRDVLHQYALACVAEEIDYKQFLLCTEELKKSLFEITGLDITEEKNRSNLSFANGVALGTTWAAMCLDDLIRSKMFVKGLYEAIHQKLQKKSSVHVLYVGTGPYATLVLPLLTLFSPQELQLTLVEVNDISFQTVSQLFSTLELTSFVNSFLHQSVMDLQLESSDEIDIFLTETMQHALLKEQQVPIVYHVLPQLHSEVILIPENIHLYLATIENKEYGAVPKAILGDIISFNKDYVYRSQKSDGDSGYTFPKKEFILKLEEQEPTPSIGIFTEIQVFGNNFITLNESGLTIPKIIKAIDNKTKEMHLSLQYKINPIPHWEINDRNINEG